MVVYLIIFAYLFGCGITYYVADKHVYDDVLILFSSALWPLFSIGFLFYYYYFLLFKEEV